MTTATLTEQTVTLSDREAMRRLLAKARKEGVRIGRDEQGRYWAHSVSTPGRLYALTAYSCTCQGFVSHQRCKHVAALLSALGWLTDTDPEPQPSMKVEIVHNRGYYEDAGWLVRSGVPGWVETSTTIFIDGQEWMSVIGDFNCRARRWNGEDMTETFPSGLDHYAAVETWLLAADGNLRTDLMLQQAGIVPAEELADAIAA